MDAFELLKQDHKKVSQLFEEIESASGQSKTQLFNQLKSELDVHAHVEEKIFYPALENKNESREITLEAYEEHKVVKDLLAELAAGSPSDEWDAKLKVLKENVEHHVEEEEGELFDKAEDVLTQDQIDQLGAEMEAEKARQQGGVPQERAAAAKKSARVKSRSTAKNTETPGVLKRLANLVGLGGDPSTPSKKTGAGPRKSGATKKAAAKAKAGGSASKGTAKATKKSGSKKPSQKAGTKKAGKGRTSAPSRTTKKTAKKAASRSSGSKKKAPSRSSGGKKKAAARKR